MGVRFECPQGHKLHVKAHLAGQRGICPECGMRFIVPSFSGGRVAEAPAGDGSRGSSGYVSVAMESTATFDAALENVEASGDNSVAWYVRPAAGGQFGPIDTAGFRQWVEEGRVGADAWIWRSGWADWRPGGEAVKALAAERPRTPPPGPAPALAGASAATLPSRATLPSKSAPAHATPLRTSSKTPAAAPRLPELNEVPAIGVAVGEELDELFSAPRNGAAPSPKPATVAARAARDKRRQHNQLLTILLAVVALVLLVVLVMVIRRGGATAPGEGAAPAEGTTTATTAATPARP
jgi:hypothetical protein